jgi:hypothetical protein
MKHRSDHSADRAAEVGWRTVFEFFRSWWEIRQGTPCGGRGWALFPAAIRLIVLVFHRARCLPVGRRQLNRERRTSNVHRPADQFNSAPPRRLPLTDAGLADRIAGEFDEMPGLALTLAQAARLFAADPAVCERTLNGLVKAGVLWTNGHVFFRAGVGRRCA